MTRNSGTVRRLVYHDPISDVPTDSFDVKTEALIKESVGSEEHPFEVSDTGARRLRLKEGTCFKGRVHSLCSGRRSWECLSHLGIRRQAQSSRARLTGQCCQLSQTVLPLLCNPASHGSGCSITTASISRGQYDYHTGKGPSMFVPGRGIEEESSNTP